MVSAAAAVAPRGRRGFGQWFMVAIAAIVVFGFSHSVDKALIRPSRPANPILYLHLLLCLSWLALMIVQAGLIRRSDLRTHRRIGVWGLGLGALVALVSLIVVFVMRHQDIALHPGDPSRIPFLAIPLESFLGFAAPFAVAALWRKRADIHRPMMMLAACGLTPAAMVRVPWLGHGPWVFVIYLGLMLLAMTEDALRRRRLSAAYLIGVPSLIVVAQVANYLAFHGPPAWTALARILLALPHGS